MNTKQYLKYLAYSLTPLALMGLLAIVPVGHASAAIPDNSKVALADTVAPSDIEGVKAKPGDGSITLNWNAATDNVGVKGYKIYYGTKPVVNDGDTYNMGVVDAGNKLLYVFKTLTNGTKYYFALTAYDAAGNESTNYSLETVSAPSADQANNQPPKVSKATAVYSDQVKVVFSEAIHLPVKNPQTAFSIKDDKSNTQLSVLDAILDQTDSNGATVLLTTATQTPKASYVLTVGIDVKDLFDNPIVSGTSDTAQFIGTDKVVLKQSDTQLHAAAKGPEMLSVEATDGNHIEVVFSKPVTLKADPRENFVVTEEQNISNTLEVRGAVISPTGTRVVIETEPQKKINYNLIAIDVNDAQGNGINIDNNAALFMGKEGGTNTDPGTEVKDITPPEDVKIFTAKMLKTLVATLEWSKSVNKAGDLAKYILYMGTDGKNYDGGHEVGVDTTTFDVTDLVPGVKYFFKLTAKDNSGNESKGKLVTFILPETGPELAFLLLGSLGLGKLFKGKKKLAKKIK